MQPDDEGRTRAALLHNQSLPTPPATKIKKRAENLRRVLIYTSLAAQILLEAIADADTHQQRIELRVADLGAFDVDVAADPHFLQVEVD